MKRFRKKKNYEIYQLKINEKVKDRHIKIKLQLSQ